MHSQSSTHYFPPEVCFAVALVWRSEALGTESLIVCLFLFCKSLPAEVRVYNGKLAPLPVLVVGNCYEITVILPLS